MRIQTWGYPSKVYLFKKHEWDCIINRCMRHYCALKNYSCTLFPSMVLHSPQHKATLTHPKSPSSPTTCSSPLNSSSSPSSTDYTSDSSPSITKSSSETESTTSTTSTASDQWLHPCLPIRYNEVYLKKLNGRSQIRTMNNLSIPLLKSKSEEEEDMDMT